MMEMQAHTTHPKIIITVTIYSCYLELLGHVPHYDAPVTCGRGDELVAVGVAEESHLLSTLRVAEGRAGCIGDGERHIVGVLPLHKWAVGGVPLMLRPGRKKHGYTSFSIYTRHMFLKRSF